MNMHAYTHRGPRGTDAQHPWAQPAPRPWLLIPFSNERNPGILWEMDDSRTGAEYTNWERVSCKTRSRDVLKKQKDGSIGKGQRKTERPQLLKLEQFKGTK